MNTNKWFPLVSFALLCLSSPCFATAIVVPSQNFPLERPAPPTPKTTDLTGFMLFQVIKDQMIFDYSNLKSASIIEHNGVFKGLLIQLKKGAIGEIEGITSAGLGKPANLVFNKKVVSTTIIQTPLGGSLLITGLTKEEAQSFLFSLNKQKSFLK